MIAAIVVAALIGVVRSSGRAMTAAALDPMAELLGPFVFGELEQLEQLADLVSDLCAVPHRRFAVDLVAVPPPDALARDVSGFDEVPHDSLRCPLGDSDGLGHVT